MSDEWDDYVAQMVISIHSPYEGETARRYVVFQMDRLLYIVRKNIFCQVSAFYSLKLQN